MVVVELDNVSKVFGLGSAATVALDQVSLTIEQGEFVAIMGPSGSGKSTLLNLIGMLDNATSGEYFFEHQPSTDYSSARKARLRRDKIGFVFQNFNLIPSMTVLENVALPLAYRGTSKPRRYKLASDMLERLDIRTKEYLYPSQLSGGQVQRAAIARALINNPPLIIADEPTGNLDTQNSEHIMELLKEINDAGNTIIMVTDNPELTRYASRILYLQDGAIRHDQQLDR